MKTCVFLIAACIACAQAPPPVEPSTVVASLPDGTKLTLGELTALLQQYPPSFMQSFQRDPARALQEVFIGQYTAMQGDKLKIGEQSPWKEQIEISRRTVVSAGMINYERNHFQVSDQDIVAYYNANKSRYEMVDAKIIKISFKPTLAAGASVEERARQAFEEAHAGTNRSEADAKKLAEDLVKQLRGGADFGKLAAKYSDDEESKNAGGDFGIPIKPTGPYAENFKKAVFGLKIGEVSDPVSANAAFYIIRAEKKTAQPVEAVRTQIMDEIKDNHLRDYLLDLQKRFQPTILRPDVVAQLNGLKK
jgi:hypothetical protein